MTQKNKNQKNYSRLENRPFQKLLRPLPCSCSEHAAIATAHLPQLDSPLPPTCAPAEITMQLRGLTIPTRERSRTTVERRVFSLSTSEKPDPRFPACSRSEFRRTSAGIVCDWRTGGADVRQSCVSGGGGACEVVSSFRGRVADPRCLLFSYRTPYKRCVNCWKISLIDAVFHMDDLGTLIFL